MHGRVKDMSLAELRSLDAGGFFAEKYRGEHIPTLEAVFEVLGKNMFINVELTNYSTPGDHLVELCACWLKIWIAETGTVLLLCFEPFESPQLAPGSPARSAGF